MELNTLTIVFARRFAAYKRPDLLLRDLEQIKQIAQEVGPIQILYAGKAHPHDTQGKETIRQIFQVKNQLPPEIRVVYLANYDIGLGKLMTSGVDLWLNTPHPPLEASGTSGMKAALNGTPSLSILDGWWVEGHLEGITGWAIGEMEPNPKPDEDRSARDAAALYEKLEQVVLPAYYKDRQEFIDIMRQAIALNGSHFNTQRMVQQYVLNAYFR